MQYDPSASSVSSCWKIIGCVYERFPILALHGSSTVQPSGTTTVFFPLTLTVASSESGISSRLTNACIPFNQSGEIRSEIILSVVCHQFFVLYA